MVFLIECILIVAFVVWLYILRQGNAKFVFYIDQRSDFALVELTGQKAVFTCEVPYANTGSQDGTLMDVYTRHLLPREYYDAVRVYSWLTLASQPRDDGYWEALIVPHGKGGTVIVTVELTAKNEDIAAGLRDMVDMPMDLVYQVVARTPLYINKTQLVMTADEIHRALHEGVKERRLA